MKQEELNRYKREGFRKEAGLTMAETTKNTIIYSAIAGMMTPIVNYGFAKGMDAVQKVKDQYNLPGSKNALFDTILETNPKLRQEDPLLVRKYYETMYKFAPSLADDPNAAGAFILQSLHYEDIGGPPQQTVSNLVKLEKDHRSINPFGMAHPDYASHGAGAFKMVPAPKMDSGDNSPKLKPVKVTFSE